MKRLSVIIYRTVVGLFFCMASGLLLAPVASAVDSGVMPEKLVFSTFPSKGMGFLFKQVLVEAYARLGIEVDVEGMPAERALVMSNQGMVDGEAARVSVIEPTNANLIRVPTPLYTNRVVVFTKRLDIDPLEGWKGLYPYKIASVLGYKFIEKKTAYMNRVLVDDYGRLFGMLENSRVDAVVSEYLEALPTLNQMDMTGVSQLATPYAYNPMYHYLHKKWAHLVPKIDAVLRDMKASGRLDEIRTGIEHSLARRWAVPCPSKQ